MVVGTVTDRLGASAELCDRESKCPLVSLSKMAEVDPADLVGDVVYRFETGRMSSVEAVDELQFAVQTGLAQPEKLELADLDKLLPILEMAANDTSAASTPQAARFQGKRRLSIDDIIFSDLKCIYICMYSLGSLSGPTYILSQLLWRCVLM